MKTIAFEEDSHPCKLASKFFAIFVRSEKTGEMELLSEECVNDFCEGEGDITVLYTSAKEAAAEMDVIIGSLNARSRRDDFCIFELEVQVPNLCK